MQPSGLGPEMSPWVELIPFSTCWHWVFDWNAYGYGRMPLQERTLAHRHAWVVARGPIPFGLCVLHRCDVRNCVRPDHLFLGTNLDNQHDMIAKGRDHNNPARKHRDQTHCKHGHELTRTKNRRYCRTCHQNESARYYAKNHQRIALARVARINRGRESESK